MPDSARLFVAGASRAWMASLSTGELLYEFDKPARFVRPIAVSNDGLVAAMALTCQRVVLYDAQTGKKTHSLKVGDGGDVSGLNFAPCSQSLFHSSWRILTAIDKSEAGDYATRPFRTLEVWPDQPMYYAITFAASGDRFACFWSGHSTYNISLLGWPTGDEIQRLSWKQESWQPHSHDEIIFTPDDQSLLLTNPDGSVSLLSLSGAESETTTIDLKVNATESEIARGHFISSLCFSPDGTLLAYKQNSALGFWEWPSGKCLGKWRAAGREPYFGQIGFTNSGREIVVSQEGSPSGIAVYQVADLINTRIIYGNQ